MSVSPLTISQAQAMRIMNLDSKAHDLVFTTLGDKQFSVRIEPNRAYSSNVYPLYVQNGKARLALDPHMEYAIWSDGLISPQRRFDWPQSPH